MNPLFHLIRTTALFLTTLLLACFTGFVPEAFGVSPAPDGGYPYKNTAEGQDALFSLTSGTANTAIGNVALKANTTGDRNTGNGALALFFNQTGSENTAIGYATLFYNKGSSNTANGVGALHDNSNGSRNTAIGNRALDSNTTGSNNTANGFQALANNTIGSFNIALGNRAGSGVSTADDVICIGAEGQNLSGTCYIGNIFNQSSPSGLAVFVNSGGKLGTTPSSRQFKEDIKPMDKTSEAILALQPVTFRYKKDFDPTGISQFGLVAEEVEKVDPDLVVRDKEGKPYSVRYDQVNAMLLNEFLKTHRKMEQQEATIARLETEVAGLAAGLQKVSAQLKLNKSASRTVSLPATGSRTPSE
jgi:trimeric autotransporter adhesin